MSLSLEERMRLGGLQERQRAYRRAVDADLQEPSEATLRQVLEAREAYTSCYARYLQDFPPRPDSHV